jgi:hypothetical protein
MFIIKLGVIGLGLGMYATGVPVWQTVIVTFLWWGYLVNNW